jgi:hypothetical protein
MEAEDIGADEGSGVAAVFPDTSSYVVKPDEAHAVSAWWWVQAKLVLTPSAATSAQATGRRIRRTSR